MFGVESFQSIQVDRDDLRGRKQGSIGHVSGKVSGYCSRQAFRGINVPGFSGSGEGDRIVRGDAFIIIVFQNIAKKQIAVFQRKIYGSRTCRVLNLFDHYLTGVFFCQCFTVRCGSVSTALVSFVLNGKEKEYRVGEKTAQRILKIANEMNYQPNLAAKSLRSGKTKTIGLVVSDISNPFFSQLARVLEDEAARKGYTVLFGSSDENKDKMNRIVGNLINKGVDGLIIVPCNNSEKSISSLVNNHIPVVLFDRYFPEINVSYVALNNFNASYIATKYLLRVGYTAPCIVAYDVNLTHMQERVLGYKKAMDEAGKKSLINVAFLKQDSPRKSADRLLPKMIDSGVDAFLFATNMISLACLYIIKDMGDDIIGKIGLVGFDGNPVFDFFDAPISYIQQPIDILVQKALEILTDVIANGNTVQSVLAEGEFIENTS